MYDRAAVAEFLATQGKDVQEMAAAFSSLRWGVKEIKCFLQGVVRDPGAKDKLYGQELQDEIAQAVMPLGGGGTVSDDFKKKGVFVIKLHLRLNEFGKTYLRAVYGPFAFLEFKEAKFADFNPHPLLRSAKLALESLVLRAIPEGRLLEIGPNIASAVRRAPSVGSYRGLVPILDSLDAERHQSALDSVRMQLRNGAYSSVKSRSGQLAAAEDALRGPNSVMFVRKTFQQNTWKADYVFGGDSFYDIPLRDAVLGLHKCGGKLIFGTIVNVPCLPDVVDGKFDEVRGQVGQTEQCWYLNREEDYICFFFKNSSSRPYKHKLSQLAEYFRQPEREFEVNGVRYLFRKTSFTNEIFLVFSIERIGYKLENLEDPAPSYRFVGNLKDVEIRSHAVDLRYAKGDSRRVVPVSITVGEDGFSRVLSDRLIRGPGKVEQVMNFARTNRVNIVHNGVRVSCDRPIALDQLRWFSIAIDALAVQLEKSAEKDVKYVQAHVNTGGWCTPAQVAVSDPGLARSLWTRMIMGMAEALPVSVVRASGVEKKVSTVETLEFEEKVEEACLRRDEQDAEELLVEDHDLDEEEVEALNAWLVFSKTRKCDCSGCFEDSSSSDTEVEFFDFMSDDGSECEDSSSSSVTGGSAETVTTVVSSLVPEVVNLERDVTVKGEARESVEEYVEILKGQMAAKEDEAVLNADRLLKSGGITAENLAILDSEKTRHYGIRVGRMGFLESTIGDAPALSEIVRVYDPVRKLFMGVEKDREGRSWVDANAASVCYSNDEFLVWVNPYIISTMTKVLADKQFGKLPQRIPFVNGIWGSGKSFLAKKWFKDRLDRGFRPLFLGASRKPTEEVRKDLYGEDKEGKKWVKTMGSFFSWGMDEKPDVLVMDEVCMEHSALVYAAIKIIQPVEFWVCGDFKQMPYVPFLAGCRPKFDSLLKSADILLLTKGHRVAKDVYAAGLTVYGKESGIHPCDCEEHVRPEVSMKVVHIDSISQVPADSDVMYLTFGQATKENVKKYLKSRGIVEKYAGERVATMAEFQGGTRKRIAVVRDVRAAKKGSIYHEEQRCNVGGSRATDELVYYTVSRERDFFVKFIESGRNSELVSIVQKNEIEARVKGDNFGLKELNEFIYGQLSADHSYVRAGRALKEKMIEDQEYGW